MRRMTACQTYRPTDPLVALQSIPGLGPRVSDLEPQAAAEPISSLRGPCPHRLDVSADLPDDFDVLCGAADSLDLELRAVIELDGAVDLPVHLPPGERVCGAEAQRGRVIEVRCQG